MGSSRYFKAKLVVKSMIGNVGDAKLANSMKELSGIKVVHNKMAILIES